MIESAIHKARQLRYKKSALQTLGWQAITDGLYDISTVCGELEWAMQDDDALLDALGGNEEEAWEFRMAFSDMSASAERLHGELKDCYIDAQDFDYVMVGLIGNRYNMVGYDGVEEDFYALVGYERNLALTEAGKRLMRYTKIELLSTIGQCLGITLAFQDLRQSYDYLQASFDILKDQDHALLDTIKDIEAVYAEAEEQWGEWSPAASRRLEMLTQSMPDRVWVE